MGCSCSFQELLQRRVSGNRIASQAELPRTFRNLTEPTHIADIELIDVGFDPCMFFSQPAEHLVPFF